MALQGTLETFALPDVLRLLASTKKTGRLRLTGGRGSGSIWLDEGDIVAGEASRSPRATEATEVVFELLRFTDGDFVFEADDASAEPGKAVSVEDALSGAEALLSEWTTIEGVVPSTAAFVSLRGDIDGEEVTLPADRWRQVVAVGGGRTVAGLGQHLGLTDMAVSRMVKELLELGVVDLGDAPDAFEDSAPILAEADSAPAWSNDSAFDETPSFTETRTFVPTPDEAPILTVVDDPPHMDSAFDGSSPVSGMDRDGDAFDPAGLVIEEPTYGSSVTGAEHAEPAVAADEPTDAAEIARQLANLSPKAAKAVAAAAKATTQEEREAALAEVDDDEEPINRGLLLKFLGSVNG